MAMDMKLNVNLKMSQKLVMTPMLQQAIKLLPLARLELAQLVRNEIIENPILEEMLEEEPDADSLPDQSDDEAEEPATEDQDQEPEEPPDYPEVEVREEAPLGETSSNETEEDTFDPSNPPQDADWESFIQNNIDQGLSVDNYTEKPSIETTYRTDPSLADHLHWQLNLSVDSENDKFIGTCIIGNIQNDGYLRTDLGEIAEICQVSEDEVLRVLKVIQGFEPNGVGARDLQECLLIQAKASTDCPPLVVRLIENYLERLEERNFAKIAAETKVSVEELLEAVHQIREFSPKPGLSFSSDKIDYVIPDIIVYKTEEGYDVMLNDDGIPQIRINPYYRSLLKTTTEGQTKEYLENKYRSAMWLIKSIDQRRQTIYKVGKSIVKLQKEFLDQGLSYLKPMVLKDVARDIEMHESTVSRITTNKYIDTPQGVYELKFFFHSGIKSYMGNNMSSIRVKNMIKDVIAEEDPRNPLTDDEMVQVLMRKNAKIARRTITKYRKEMNIPPASKRKRLY